MAGKLVFRTAFIPFKWLVFLPNPSFAQDLTASMNAFTEEGYDFEVREISTGMLITGKIEEEGGDDGQDDDLPTGLPSGPGEPGDLQKAVATMWRVNGTTLRAQALTQEILGSLPSDPEESLRLLPRRIGVVCGKYSIEDCQAAVRLIREAAKAHEQSHKGEYFDSCPLAVVYGSAANELEKYASGKLS